LARVRRDARSGAPPFNARMMPIWANTICPPALGDQAAAPSAVAFWLLPE
jgi:hypothetical protein